MEIALIAFDALDPRVLYRNRDKLSTFDRVMENSMHGRWRTPGHTIPSFIATLTGRQYEVVNFHWDEGRGEYQRHRQTEFDFIWDVCDSSMTLLNMPVLYPPEDIDDCMVCGFLTPDSQTERNLARPLEVQDMLNDIDYIHDVHADRTYEQMGGEHMLRYLHQMMMIRVTAADNLIDMYDSDLFYGAWTATDRWFHQCVKHGVDHMPMYGYADSVLREMLEILPDDIPVIVFSDHGFAHYSGDEGVHKGHMYEGWYSIMSDNVPHYRDNSASLYDLFPTVVNYLGCDIPDNTKGRILMSTEEQNEQVEDRLNSLGYL